MNISDSSNSSEWPWPWPWTRHDQRKGISKDVYDDLVRYTKYSSGAYQILCARPMGNQLVTQFTDLISSTHGYIARDDTRKEIVVAFRGSQNISHILLDSNVILTPLQAPGIDDAGDARVHTGFLFAFSSVASTVLSRVELQLKEYPDYGLICTGHSLGGSLASIGAISLKCSFPGVLVKLFTFGQPRTGNKAFSTLVETILEPCNIFRAVHSFDGVPTMIPIKLGYHHHATEYWQFTEPPSPDHVKECSGGEDPDGSASMPSTGINLPHMVYFGQPISQDPTVCL
ncbi:Alpha/Beta hydrolase protein [Hygrophoropsis aurantiaca]|uniref:Alpha/Beta hydrolase protein n=1 Tax=Hygrophoropsis aurantiaca TaxID=72124 RepID=A0ACB8A115_9AGAM|nr:Alpha/Beta hydrolase protein [Hygrophoropsis aurantiaca]